MPLLTDRLEFYHVPRTGGTWTARRFGRWHKRTPIGLHKVGESHDIPLAARDAEAERVRFTIAREPWEWFKSWYRLLTNAKAMSLAFTGGVPHGLMFHECPLDEGFEMYLRFYLASMPGRASSIWLAYMDQTDVWLRTDRLTDGLFELFARVGMDEFKAGDLAPSRGVNGTTEKVKATWPCEASEELIDRWKMAEASLYDAYDAAWSGNDANIYDND